MLEIPKPMGIPCQRTMGILVMLAVLLNITLRNLSVLVSMASATTSSETALNEPPARRTTVAVDPSQIGSNFPIMEQWLQHEERGGPTAIQQCEIPDIGFPISCLMPNPNSVCFRLG
jgi:hypothetical protein